MELVLVKGFEDIHVDLGSLSTRATCITIGRRELGPKLAAGIKAARAPIISFLEDDDLFESTKLDRVIKSFNSDPDLDFYHNNYTPIDEKGVMVAGRSPQVPRSRAATDKCEIEKSPINELATVRLARALGPFNNSCISLSRRLANEILPYLERIDLAVDSFLFFTAVCNARSVSCDSVSLTRVRLHPGSVSNSPKRSAQALREFSSRNSRSYEVWGDFEAQHPNVVGRRAWKATLVAESTLKLLRGAEDADRFHLARGALEATAFASSYPLRTRPSLVGLALLAPLSLRLARAAYYVLRFKLAG